MKQSKMKKIVAFVFATIMFVTMTIQPMMTEAVSNEITAADFNADGILTGADVDVLRQVLLEDAKDSQYDLTGNGTVDVQDLVRIKRVIFDYQTAALNGNISGMGEEYDMPTDW